MSGSVWELTVSVVVVVVVVDVVDVVVVVVLLSPPCPSTVVQQGMGDARVVVLKMSQKSLPWEAG